MSAVTARPPASPRAKGIEVDPALREVLSALDAATGPRKRRLLLEQAERISAPSGGIERARRILAYEDAKAAAGPNAFMAGFDQFVEIDNPGHIAAKANQAVDRSRAWRERRAHLEARHGGLAAVLLPCDRERMLVDALAPWRVACDAPHERWTLRLANWDATTPDRDIPEGLRTAAENAYPMPTTFDDAKAELDYWTDRNSDIEHAMSEDGRSNLADDGLDKVAQLRMTLVRGLVEHGLRLATLPEITERFRMERGMEWADKRMLDAIFRDLDDLNRRTSADVRGDAVPSTSGA